MLKHNKDDNSHHDSKYPDLITQVNKGDPQKPGCFKRMMASPCCRPFLRCFSMKDKYFTEGNSLSLSGIKNPMPEALLGPQLEDHKGRKTLVLDLDETLVHSSFDQMAGTDIVLPVKIQGNTYHINVIKRPGTEEFIERMGQIYEVVVFTASLPEYAEPLVEILDEGRVINHLLFRHHCTPLNGIYVKDLSKIGRDIKNVILVDNSPNSFLFQPDNAFHIKNFFDDKSDKELWDLAAFLEFVANVDDVRPVDIWRKKFASYSTQTSSDKSEVRSNSYMATKKNKIRQESTDSNAPLFNSNLKKKAADQKANQDLQASFQDPGQFDDDFNDIDMRDFEATKSLRHNKEKEIPLQALKNPTPDINSYRRPGQKPEENEGNDSEMVESYLPSPKESDGLIHTGQAALRALTQKNGENQKNNSHKFQFPGTKEGDDDEEEEGYPFENNSSSKNDEESANENNQGIDDQEEVEDGDDDDGDDSESQKETETQYFNQVNVDTDSNKNEEVDPEGIDVKIGKGKKKVKKVNKNKKKEKPPIDEIRFLGSEFNPNSPIGKNQKIVLDEKMLNK